MRRVQLLPNFRIAVVGSGISGLSCAWALSQRHDVTLIEADNRLGGHAHTVAVKTSKGPIPVDTGFIVFNSGTYPNFTALLDYLDQPVTTTQMTFSVSAEQGRYEYSGHRLGTLVGTPRQWFSPKHWRMMTDLLRFYRQAELDAATAPIGMTLGGYLKARGYGETFMRRHILPMAGAIWSSTPDQIAAYPLQAFVRFFANHKLFDLEERPDWSTVSGGSRAYVEKLIEDSKFTVRLSSPVSKIHRGSTGAEVLFASGERETFDHVVIATHGDTALRLLAEPTDNEVDVLRPFTTSANRVYLHRDETLMPRYRKYWSSWNYRVPQDEVEVAPEITYWMNSLQNLATSDQYFVSLNPKTLPDPASTDSSYNYRHPIFNAQTMEAQKHLWTLQGVDRIWYCGAWFGAGFHEDGLQAGLAVAEQLGSVRRPWQVENESDRICLAPRQRPMMNHFVEAAE
jgi:uncharacterized protein